MLIQEKCIFASQGFSVQFWDYEKNVKPLVLYRKNLEYDLVYFISYHENML